MNPELWLAGYGAWPAPVRAERLVKMLRLRGVTRLIDARLNPSAADPEPGRTYGPKPWNLQAGRELGIVGLLGPAGISYEWLVELGNPQRRDSKMAILRSQLDDPLGGWPVHRGLDRLASAIREPGAVVTILCACEHWQTCHRTVVAQALSERHFDRKLRRFDLKSGQAIPDLPTMNESSENSPHLETGSFS